MSPEHLPPPVLECRALLLDVDGTLVDSVGATRAAWSVVAAELGADPVAVADVSVSRRASELVDELFPAPVRERALAASKLAQVASAALVVPLPGAAALLASLPAGSWACVTSGRREVMSARLTAAGLPVPDALVTAEDVVRGKPDPEPYVRGAEVLGVPAAECVAFEDTPDGIASARAAGVRVVGVGGSHPAAALLAAGAVAVVAHTGDVEVTVRGGTLRLALGPSSRHP